MGSGFNSNGYNFCWTGGQLYRGGLGRVEFQLTIFDAWSAD